MSERLTDGELARLSSHVARSATLDGHHVDRVARCLMELIERRCADLTSDDRDELAVLASALRERVEHQRIITRIDDRHERALAVLDKLLGEGQR